MEKRVLLIGGAGTKTPCPIIVPGGERWGINNLISMPTGPKRFKGATRWFDLHHKEHIVTRRGGGNVWGWYQKLEIPVYLWDVHPDLPTSKAYPRSDVQAMFGGTRLFNSSLDWLLALALYEEFTDIDLYAFRLDNFRYMHQVSSGQWWLNECIQRGVRVTALSPCMPFDALSRRVVMNPPPADSTHLMYGFETTDRSKLYHGR